MHAFDYDMLSGHEIVVKCAANGDIFQTLDGQERKLDDTILMINDAEKAVGIAGIIGGENSKKMCIRDRLSPMNNEQENVKLHNSGSNSADTVNGVTESCGETVSVCDRALQEDDAFNIPEELDVYKRQLYMFTVISRKR